MAKSDTKDAAEAPSAKRPGFNAKNEAYPGVDPESGERKALTFEGAKKEFGARRGAEVYEKVALAGGFGRVEGGPDLSLVGLSGEHKKEVERILAEAGGQPDDGGEG